MTKRQKDMLKALEACFLNITEAAKMVGMNRDSHYQWLGKNDDYKKEYKALEDDRIKIAESQLHKNIMGGKETSLIFFLKCKAGYTEKVPDVTTVQEVRKWSRPS